MRIAIVGTPGSGKTTLFCAFSGINYTRHLESGQKLRTATVKVQDERIYKIHKLAGEEKNIVLPSFEIIDTDPILPGKENQDNNKKKFSKIRQCDGFVIVVMVTKLNNNPIDNFYKEIEKIKAEMVFADLDLLLGRIERLKAQTKKKPPSPDEQREINLLCLLQENLAGGNIQIYKSISDSEKKMVRGFQLLSEKPIFPIANIQEEDIKEAKKFLQKNITCLSLKLEADLCALEQEERDEFMKSYNLEELTLPTLPLKIYKAMGLIIFFTIGKNEVAGWGIAQNSNAIDAAGKIHSDIARGFISAEVVKFDDFVKFGSMKKAQMQGKLRLEGKDYKVKDGDVIYFRFSV